MGAQAADIYTNDFDSSFSDWSASGNVALSGTVDMGGKALRLKQTASAVKSVDISGFSNVNVSMNLAASGLENGDECFAEINDGSGWVTYVQLGNGQDNKTFHLAYSSATALSDNANVRSQIISDWVPECQNGINGTNAIWNDVTIEDNFDMATGNYRLSSYEGDEGGSNAVNNFFLVLTHAQKIQHACERYIRKATPNTHFSYHSSDTYIGGLAMDAYSVSSDLFTDLVNTIYKPLGLSPVTYETVRT